MGWIDTVSVSCMTQKVDRVAAVPSPLSSTTGLSTRCLVRGVFPCSGYRRVVIANSFAMLSAPETDPDVGPPNVDRASSRPTPSKSPASMSSAYRYSSSVISSLSVLMSRLRSQLSFHHGQARVGGHVERRRRRARRDQVRGEGRDHRAVVGAQPGPRNPQGQTVCRTTLLGKLPQSRVGGDAPG